MSSSVPGRSRPPSVTVEDGDGMGSLVNITGKAQYHGHGSSGKNSVFMPPKRGMSVNESFSYINTHKKSAHWNIDQENDPYDPSHSSLNITAFNFNRKMSKVSAEMHAVNRILDTLQQAKKVVLKYSSFLSTENSSDGAISPGIEIQQSKQKKRIGSSCTSSCGSGITMPSSGNTQLPGDEISEALIKNININITQLKSLKLRMIKDETVKKFDDSLKVSEQFGQYYLAYFSQKKEEPTMRQSLEAKAVVLSSDFVFFLKTLEKIGGKRGLEITDKQTLLKMLENVHTFDFNSFELDQCTNMPLTVIMYVLFSCFKLFHELKICKETFVDFMLQVEAKSHVAIAHAALYSASMAQAAHVLLLTPAVTPSNLEILAVFIACAIRCVDHKGGSNQFLIATDPDLSETYLNLHPMENHCLHVGLGLLQEPGCDFLSALAWEDRTSTRRIVSYLMPCTDPECHMDLMVDLNTMVLKKTNRDVEDRQVLLQTLYRSADLATFARPLQECKQWMNLYKKEHFHQGDMEAKLDIPISPMCNRQSSDFNRWVMTILDFVVNPLFEMWAEGTDGHDIWRRTLENREYFLRVLKMINVRPASFSGQIGSRQESTQGSRRNTVTSNLGTPRHTEIFHATPRNSKNSTRSVVDIALQEDITNERSLSGINTGGVYLDPGLAPPPLSDPRLPGYLKCQALQIRTGKQHLKKR